MSIQRELIVDDAAAPTNIPGFSDDELATVPLRDLYVARCAQLGMRHPDPAVVKQLPAGNAAERHLVVAIDASLGGYSGDVGVQALVPVVMACPRLADLRLKSAGMKGPTARALFRLLESHPGVRRLDVSGNPLGSAAGEALVRLCLRRKQIVEVDVTSTLLIEPIKRRLTKQLLANGPASVDFTAPAIPDELRADEIAAERREVARQVAAEEARVEALNQLPSWAPAAILQLSLALVRHRHNMLELFAQFGNAAASASTKTAAAGSSTQESTTTVVPPPPSGEGQRAVVTPRQFARVMRMLACSELVDASRCTAFASLFGADATPGLIDAESIVSTLRVHAQLALPDGTTLFTGSAVDAWYDRRIVLQQSLELLDLDQRNVVLPHELESGLASMAGDLGRLFHNGKLVASTGATCGPLVVAALPRHSAYPDHVEYEANVLRALSIARDEDVTLAALCHHTVPNLKRDSLLELAAMWGA